MSILRYENVEWSLPYLFGYDIELIKIVKILEDFEDSIKINAFGAPKSKWSGGRCSAVSTDDKDYIMRLFSYLISIGVTPSLTFSNYHIVKDDLNDPFCNYILDIANDLGCNLIVSSNLLFDYIKNKYPSAICTASVIKPIFEFQNPQKMQNYNVEEEISFYNTLLKKYDKVVIRPEFAKYHLPKVYTDFDDLSKIEVLVNQSCVPSCPLATNHYIHTEQIERETKELTEEDTYFECYNKIRKRTLLEEINDSLYFETDEVDRLVNIGIKHLKLQGRAGTQNYIMPLLSFYNYVLKPAGKTLRFQYLFHGEYKKEIDNMFKTEILRQPLA